MIKNSDQNLTLENFFLFLHSLPNWLMTNVFTFSTTIQFVIIIVCCVLGWFIAKRISNWLKQQGKTEDKNFIIAFFAQLHLSIDESLRLFCTTLLLWIATALAWVSTKPSDALNIVSALLSAWIFVKLLTGTISSYFWAKISATVIWFFAALYIIGWFKPFINILDATGFSLGNHQISILSLFKCGILITFLLWISDIFTKKADSLLSQTHALNHKQKKTLVKIIQFFFGSMAVIIGLNTLGIDLTAITVFGGALGVSIGVGLQRIFANMISGLVLHADKSVKIGDLIAVSDTVGWVNKIGVRYVSVISRDGKQHLIPNELLITSKIENWSYDSTSLRISIPISVSLNADKSTVKNILLECAQNNSHVLRNPEPMSLIKSFSGEKVDMELVVWINDPAYGLNIIRHELYESIWEKFKVNEIF